MTLTNGETLSVLHYGGSVELVYGPSGEDPLLMGGASVRIFLLPSEVDELIRELRPEYVPAAVTLTEKLKALKEAQRED